MSDDLNELSIWLQEQQLKNNSFWLIKRLAANDTLATGGHQSGPYIPRNFFFAVFPELNNKKQYNPDVRFNSYLDSHHDHKNVRGVWYNNKHFGKTRDETRLTRFGGSSSALLDAENTGELVVMVFHRINDVQDTVLHVWVCEQNGIEADYIENLFGEVEPGVPFTFKYSHRSGYVHLDSTPIPLLLDCRLSEKQMPDEWKQTFPKGMDIIRKAVELSPLQHEDVDGRLLRRRKCEFEIFRSLEKYHWKPKIRGPFESVDQFVSLANKITNSRKSRAGNSLEYHILNLFAESNMNEGVMFDHNKITENNKKPDFVFPSQKAYLNNEYPAEKLRMLAAKTTLKDRWRQVLNEADRIPQKHLITLQEGVSCNQYQEMVRAGIKLVVPKELHKKFPKDVRPELLKLSDFIREIKSLYE